MWTVSLAECSPHTILSLSQGSRVPENHIHGVHSPPFKVTETLENHVHGEPRWSSVSPSAQGHRDRTCRESRPSGLALGQGLPGKRLSVSRHVRPHDKHGTSFWGVNYVKVLTTGRDTFAPLIMHTCHRANATLTHVQIHPQVSKDNTVLQ